MPHPLLFLADKLDRLMAERRGRRAGHDVQADPHIARDIGLPYRPQKKQRPELW